MMKTERYVAGLDPGCLSADVIMKYQEENIARNLYAVLGETLGSSSTHLAVQGVGVHWYCELTEGGHHCKINCFHYRQESRPEYYTIYSREGKEVARSRVSIQEHAIEAVRDWLSGASLEALYDKYSFVDQRKRVLLTIRDEVYAISGELRDETLAVLTVSYGDSYMLQVQSKNRASEIGFYGGILYPDARFKWDGCQLFQFQVDDNQLLADVLVSWLCREAPPSELRQLFPWIEIGQLADYYEAGDPILGEFIQSWDWIEKFYRESLGDWELAQSVLGLMREMRRLGYDKSLRAGQSLTSLGLSRSRRHGLRDEQPCVWFDFLPPDRMKVSTYPESDALEDHPIQLTGFVRDLLDNLVACPIS